MSTSPDVYSHDCIEKQAGRLHGVKHSKGAVGILVDRSTGGVLN